MSLLASSTPLIMPMPRTSFTVLGYFFASFSVSWARKYSPVLTVCSSRPSLSMVSREASARPQARGPPAKVEPWVPGMRVLAASPRAQTAPMGTPEPSAFAMEQVSGSTP